MATPLQLADFLEQGSAVAPDASDDILPELCLLRHESSALLGERLALDLECLAVAGQPVAPDRRRALLFGQARLTPHRSAVPDFPLRVA